jgi:hypothetical protein
MGGIDWRYLKQNNWALGSMSIISLRQTVGWPYVGAAAPSRMGRRGINTLHTSDNWLESANGSTTNHE